MFQSLLRFPTKPRGIKDAEKELVEVMDLFSEYPVHLVETDKNEFKSEYDRLKREIGSYKAGDPTAKLNVDIILDDCKALKCKVKRAISDYARGEVLAPTASVGGLEGHQTSNPPPVRDALETKSSHLDQPPSVKTIASLPATSADILATDETRFKPQSAGPSNNPRSGLPQNDHIPVHSNLKQAISQVTSGIPCVVDSIEIVGSNVKCPTLNIDSPDCTGAKILSDGPQVTQQVPQPVRPRRAVGRRAQQQPRNFMNTTYSSNSSIIMRGSNVMGATLNVGSTHCSGAVFHRGNHLKSSIEKKDRDEQPPK